MLKKLFAAAAITLVFAALLPARYVTAESVTWVEQVNVSVNGSALVSNSPCNCGDADSGALSQQRLTSGDGYFEFVVGQNPQSMDVGLSSDTSAATDALNMDFAFRFFGRYVEVREKNSYKTDISVSGGDKFRVAIESGKAKYYQNNTLIYTSNQQVTYPLVADASLYKKDISISDSAVSFSINPTPTPQPTPPPAGGPTPSPTPTPTPVPTPTPPPTGGPTPVPPTTPSRYKPTGSLDGIDQDRKAVFGWAKDSDDDFQPIKVHLYFDINTGRPGAKSFEVLANKTRSDVGAHAFEFAIPSEYQDGKRHTVWAWGIDLTNPEKNRQLLNSPKRFRVSNPTPTPPPVGGGPAPVNQKPTGFLDGVDTTTGNVWGWAMDPDNTAASIDVHLYFNANAGVNGATAVFACKADKPRADLPPSGNHGFSCQIPSQYRSGQTHQVWAWGIDLADSKNNTQLQGSPKSFAFTTTPTPDSIGIIDTPSYKSYPAPAKPNLPSAGGIFNDKTFGTQIMRITDSGDNNISYSYWHTFNKDSTKLYVSYANGSPVIYDFDPVNFKLGSKTPAFQNTNCSSEDAIWSGIDPNLIYCHDQSGNIKAYNIVTKTAQAVASIGVNTWQMSKSEDDKVFGFTWKNASYGNVGWVVYNKTTGKITKVEGDIDEAQVDKTGKWLVYKTGNSGAGVIESKIINLETGATESLTDNGPDFGPGHSDNGKGIVVGDDNWNNRITKRNLATPHQFTGLFTWPDYSQADHLSMLASDESWVLVSSYGDNNSKFSNQIFEVATDGSGKVRHLAHHFSNATTYESTPRASISRDGKFVTFVSNWGGTRTDIFVAKVR